MPTICMQCGDPSSVLVQGFCSVHCFDVAFSSVTRSGPSRMDGLSERIEVLEQAAEFVARKRAERDAGCLEESEKRDWPDLTKTKWKFKGQWVWVEGVELDGLDESFAQFGFIVPKDCAIRNPDLVNSDG